jgi:DNA-directed RNA polymerase specialized sigma24 family protein
VVNPVDALLKFRGGQLSREALAATVYPLLKRLAKATAWKVRGVDADDLAQELWLTFDKSVLKNYEPGVALEPYLLVIARNTAFQMRGKVRETAESDITDSSSPNKMIDARPLLPTMWCCPILIDVLVYWKSDVVYIMLR